jgi:hypothetical protein
MKNMYKIYEMRNCCDPCPFGLNRILAEITPAEGLVIIAL